MNSHKPHGEPTPSQSADEQKSIADSLLASLGESARLRLECELLRDQVAKLRSAAQLALEWSEVSPVDPQFRSEVAATLRAALA